MPTYVQHLRDRLYTATRYGRPSYKASWWSSISLVLRLTQGPLLLLTSSIRHNSILFW